MSFQHFRLGELALHQPLPPHLVGAASSTSTFQATTTPDNSASAANTTTFQINNVNPNKSHKQPYGSGDTDDGYTLVFPNLAEFEAWRKREEETQSVEFVKGDTHGSKALPPRFKEHTKLVCARHSRSGRKKYVKKYPERVRKVPSRKLEGTGCGASISYKTYYDSEEVRACYNSQHSHPIGTENLPFTRRGRKEALAKEKTTKTHHASTSSASNSAQVQQTPVPVATQSPIQSVGPNNGATAGPSNNYSNAVSMLAPLPPQGVYQQPPQQVVQPFGYAPTPQAFTANNQAHNQAYDRWENMATLFNSIREHARSHEYPAVSVAALETVLIRLYLESPVGMGLGAAHASMMNTLARQPQMMANVANGTGSTGGNSSDGSGAGADESS